MYRTPLLLLMLAVLAGCTDRNTTFTEADTGSTTAAEGTISPVMMPQLQGVAGKKGGNVPQGLQRNSQRYANNSMPAASGRDGEVTVQARALRGGDGNVTLEVTTGELDSDDTPPGNIAKLLVKGLDANNPDPDAPVWEENYNKLRDGGYWSTAYDNLDHGQPFFVHANVRGIIRGTAVVKLTGEVTNRPDPAVTEIDAPTSVGIGELFSVLATVTELAQDNGATMDCVMSVDGAEVDRAEAIWVDAGDAVHCQFPLGFGAPGVYQVTVAVENVVPGDYDVSNNVLGVTVEATEANEFYWSASATIDLEDFFYSSNYYYGYYYYSGWGKRSHGAAYGWKEGVVGFPLDASFSLTSGGHDWVNESYSNVDAFWYDWYYGGIWYQYLPDGAFVQVYGGGNYNRTHAWVQRYSEQTTYYSYYYWYGGWYSHRTDDLPQHGTDLTFEINLDGSVDSATMSGSIDLYETSTYYNYCDWWGCYYGQWYGNYPSYLQGWGSGSPNS